MALADTVTMHGAAGTSISLPVAQGPATGYRWTLTLPPGVSQVADAPGQPIPLGQHLGSAAGGALCVVAERDGHYRITATLARPWDADHPARVVVILLTVG